jgi:hypothetical protein
MSWEKVAEVMRMSEWEVKVEPTGYKFVAWEWTAGLKFPEGADSLLADPSVFREALRIIVRTAGIGDAFTERGAYRKVQKHIASWTDAMPGPTA